MRGERRGRRVDHCEGSLWGSEGSCSFLGFLFVFLVKCLLIFLSIEITPVQNLKDVEKLREDTPFVANVTDSLQFFGDLSVFQPLSPFSLMIRLVKDSKLQLSSVSKTSLIGFYDPCPSVRVSASSLVYYFMICDIFHSSSLTLSQSNDLFFFSSGRQVSGHPVSLPGKHAQSIGGGGRGYFPSSERYFQRIGRIDSW